MVNRLPRLILTGLAIAVSSAAQAQSPNHSNGSGNGTLNPCPNIYYEAPLNDRILSPAGCPPNAARKARPSGNAATADPTQPTELFPIIPAEPTVQPLPEELGYAIEQIAPQDQQVNVTLTNDTNVIVTYEVIGQTDLRSLFSGETVVLEGLSLPSTISAVRNDSGQLNFNTTVDQGGQLRVNLDANTQLYEVQGVLQIQADGEVFLN